MRPDEHKKKRSSDYKKKHAIDKKHVPPTGKEFSSQPTVPLSDEESGKYRRGEIKSNWERYDDIKDDEADRGEDYSILVGRGGDASSHKKLTGEDDWDAEVKLEDFDIDYNSLACQLSKLPLIQRFRLDKLGLDSDILKCLEENGSCETFSHSTNIKVSTIPCNINFINKDESSDLGFNFSMKPVYNAPLRTNLDAGQDDIYEKNSSPDCGIKVDSKVQDDTMHGGNIQDDQLLDELLQSTNATAEPPITDNSTNRANEEQKVTVIAEESDANAEVDDLEDWLDSIL